MARDTESEEDAKTIALSIAHAALPSSRFENTILADDIISGRWDTATDSFVADPSEREAVMVNTQQLASRSNSVALSKDQQIEDGVGWEQGKVTRQHELAINAYGSRAAPHKVTACLIQIVI